jgi:hypothetical protein
LYFAREAFALELADVGALPNLGLLLVHERRAAHAEPIFRIPNAASLVTWRAQTTDPYLRAITTIQEISDYFDVKFC